MLPRAQSTSVRTILLAVASWVRAKRLDPTLFTMLTSTAVSTSEQNVEYYYPLALEKRFVNPATIDPNI